MAIKTDYSCDACLASQNTKKQFWEVGVAVRCHDGPQYTLNYHRKMDLCRNCLEAFGIYVSEETKKSPEYQPPSLEDMIIQIVQQGIEDHRLFTGKTGQGENHCGGGNP